jgi:hypothetical protein
MIVLGKLVVYDELVGCEPVVIHAVAIRCFLGMQKLLYYKCTSFSKRNSPVTWACHSETLNKSKHL